MTGLPRIFLRRSVGLACALLLPLATCAGPRTIELRLKDSVALPQHCAVIFFADGMDRARLHAMLNAGELPNIRRRFVEGGVSVENAIVCLPSITYPNAVSLMTGRFPGSHGILGNRWFDRHSLQCSDYVRANTYRDVNQEFFCPTLHEVLDDHLTASVHFHTHRGADIDIDNSLRNGVNWLFGDFTRVDRRTGKAVGQIARTANQVGRWPTLTVYYFPGLDEVGHHEGSESARYADALRNVDAQIGRVWNALEQAGIADRTYFALVTDHNHIPMRRDRVFDVEDWLEDRCGLDVHESGILRRGYVSAHHHLADDDVRMINDVYRCDILHVRGPHGWSEPADPERINRILHGRPDDPVHLAYHPAIALIALREGADRIRLLGRGEAAVERRVVDGRNEYRYVLPDASTSQFPDPLEIESDDLLTFDSDDANAGWRGSRDWLSLTAADNFPDFIPQIVEMLDSPRAGDIVLFAANDWSFSDRDNGGHGSALASDMRVPMYFAGPELPAGGTINCARLVDVAPTILDLLGEGERIGRFGPIDGVSIAGELRQAGIVAPR